MDYSFGLSISIQPAGVSEDVLYGTSELIPVMTIATIAYKLYEILARLVTSAHTLNIVVC